MSTRAQAQKATKPTTPKATTAKAATPKTPAKVKAEKDPRDFGETPTPSPSFKLPAELPPSRTALLALVAAQGQFPPRAARWLSPAELRLLLTEAFPFESSAIYAVREPRQIKDRDELLTLCAERRVNYYAELRERKEPKTHEESKTDEAKKSKGE